LAERNPVHVGRGLGAELFHDRRSVTFDGAAADAALRGRH
jgi:hypothetical protein